MTKHKVLIPLDGSDFSRQILQMVDQYLQPTDNELVLLRVAMPLLMPTTPVETPQRYVWTAEEREAHRTQILQELEHDASKLRAKGYPVTLEVLFGEAGDEISDYVKRANIDLVAMTTHGRTGLGRLVLGSVAEHVLRTVHTPVLLWRPV